MILLPAIDIQQGACVRLKQGDFKEQTVYGSSPVDIARRWEGMGAEWLHVIDLDGARTGRSVNSDLIFKMAAESGVPIQLGGGIRSLETIDTYLANGIERVILGTAAIENRELLERAVDRYGSRIAVSIDSRNGRPAISGWTRETEGTMEELAAYLHGAGVEILISTDIGKDGMLGGPNFEELGRLQQSVPVKIIASGGITTENDVAELARQGFYGAITGKAIYENESRFGEMMEGLL